MAVKECRHCRTVKALEAFDRSKDGLQGRAARCKDCRRAYNRAAYYRKRDGTPALRPLRSTGQPKACLDCGQVQEPDAFFRSTRSSDGRSSYCKPCHGVRVQASKDKKGGSRDYHLRLRYGITAAEADAMLESQGGRCASCRERPAQHVDHDHLTGKVRGMLCSCCNQGLGSFRDDARHLRRAIDYLERTTWTRHQVSTGVFQLTSPRPAAAASASS